MRSMCCVTNETILGQLFSQVWSNEFLLNWPTSVKSPKQQVPKAMNEATTNKVSENNSLLDNSSCHDALASHPFMPKEVHCWNAQLAKWWQSFSASSVSPWESFSFHQKELLKTIAMVVSPTFPSAWSERGTGMQHWLESATELGPSTWCHRAPIFRGWFNSLTQEPTGIFVIEGETLCRCCRSSCLWLPCLSLLSPTC